MTLSVRLPPEEHSAYARGKDLFEIGGLAKRPKDPLKQQIWEKLQHKHGYAGWTRLSHKTWVDTGFLVALFAADDKHHKGAVAFIKEHQDMEMHSIWPVIVETCFFLNNQGKD